MVSPIRQKTVIWLEAVDGTFMRFEHGWIIENVVINWGRSSLFDEPISRTADLTVMLPTDPADLANLLYAKLRISWDSVLLFEGSLDRIEHQTKRINGRSTSVYKLSAIEHSRLWPSLAATLADIVKPADTYELWNEFHNRWKLNVDDIEIVDMNVNNPIRYAFKSTIPSTTLFDAFSAIAATPPLARANWLPGRRKVQSTAWDTGKFSNNSYMFPSFCEPLAPLSASLDQTPQSVLLQSGGQFGDRDGAEERIWFSAKINGGTAEITEPFRMGRAPRRFPPRVVTQPIAVSYYPNSEFGAAAKLLSRQITDPPRVRIRDSVVLTNAPRYYAWLFHTWESKDTKMTIGSDKNDWSPPPGAWPYETRLRGKNLLPIGGTLRIGHDVTTHDLTLIYV